MDKIEEIVNLLEGQQEKQNKELFLKYLKKWYWFILCSSLGIILGFCIFKKSPNIYEVNSQILVKEENTEFNSVLSFNNPIMPLRNANVENKIGILKSYTLFRKALTNLNWDITWYKKELLYNQELYKNSPFELIIPPNAINAQNVLIEIIALNDKKYTIRAKGKTSQNGYLQTIDIDEVAKFNTTYNNEFFNFILNVGNANVGEVYYLRFNNLNSTTKYYLHKTNIISVDPNSDLITISIKGMNVQKEADFINELNNVFIQFGVENKNISSNNSLEFIDSQLTRIKTKLKSAEERFSTYRKNKQVINLSQEAQLIYQKMEELEEEKYMTQLQIDYYRDLLQYLDDSEKISDMVNPSIIGITDPGLNNMLSKLMELYSRKEILSYSVKEKNPSFQMLEKEIMITRDGLEETIRNQLKATESILESAETRYASIQDRVKQLPETEKELIGIQRDFDLNDELYTYLLQKRAEASISKASIAPEVQIIDPALVESSIQVGPSLVKHIGIGLAGGLFFPFVLITLLSYFNSKIETKEEIEKASKIPVFEGIIRHKYREKLPVIHHPRSGIAESFRGVKSNINTILEKSSPRIISINSLIPGEGKSFISSNLSATLANSNKRALLIGTDLHKPTLHKYLDIEESEGLGNYLADEKNINEIITQTAIPHLHFIQAGIVKHNPSDLLHSEKFKNLLETIKNNYDYIIIDNAPILLVPDAIITSRLSDISLFILRINYSRKQQIKQIQKIVSFNKIKCAAFLINSASYQGYGYGYKYYKKGYGEFKHKMSIA